MTTLRCALLWDRTDRVKSPVPESGTREGGLRERHKRSTRQQLEESALRLFARNGFDATTVEAIAADAGVSPRTFFRYFGSKHEVLDAGRELRQARLNEAVMGLTDPTLTDLTVALEALIRIAPEFDAARASMLLRRQAALTSPVLRGRLYDASRSWELALVSALAQRRGAAAGDLVAQTAGAVAIALWQHAIDRWLREPGSPLATHLQAGRGALGR